MKLSSLLSAALLGSIVLMSGCVSKTVAPNNTGFFKTYEGLDGKHGKFEKSTIEIAPEADFAHFKNVYVSPVSVISGVSQERMTAQQKELYLKMAEYVREGYKKEIKNNGIYTLVEDKNSKDTLTLDIALSAVEVHFDDNTWYQLTPIELGLTGISSATYLDGAVRILGESRLTDVSNGKVLLRTMTLQKGEEIGVQSSSLSFDDVKPALDAWLKRSTENLALVRKEVIKFEEKK